MSDPTPDAETAQDLFSNYSEYNKSLRTWFVTFGLGGPSLFLVNDKLGDRLTASPHSSDIIGAFLLGCVAQIIIVVVNKNCAWHAYNAKRCEHLRKRWDYRFWLWLERCYWIDMLADFGTALLYLFALWQLMAVFLAPNVVLPLITSFN